MKKPKLSKELRAQVDAVVGPFRERLESLRASVDDENDMAFISLDEYFEEFEGDIEEMVRRMNRMFLCRESQTGTRSPLGAIQKPHAN